jgi:hypothetical protein
VVVDALRPDACQRGEHSSSHCEVRDGRGFDKEVDPQDQKHPTGSETIQWAGVAAKKLRIGACNPGSGGGNVEGCGALGFGVPILLEALGGGGRCGCGGQWARLLGTCGEGYWAECSCGLNRKFSYRKTGIPLGLLLL